MATSWKGEGEASRAAAFMNLDNNYGLFENDKRVRSPVLQTSHLNIDTDNRLMIEFDLTILLMMP